jgi:hypothetical protein
MLDEPWDSSRLNERIVCDGFLGEMGEVLPATWMGLRKTAHWLLVIRPHGCRVTP